VSDYRSLVHFLLQQQILVLVGHRKQNSNCIRKNFLLETLLRVTGLGEMPHEWVVIVVLLKKAANFLDRRNFWLFAHQHIAEAI
jgi:hypothetical protein